jgi:hypothetical protein
MRLRGATTAIAGITARELLRLPTTRLIALISVLLLLVLPFLPTFALGETAATAMVKETALATVGLALLLIAVLGAANVVHREIEDRTLITLLAKPVSRARLLIGKYAGVLAALSLIWLILGVTLILTLVIFHAKSTGRGTSAWAGALTQAETRESPGPVPAWRVEGTTSGQELQAAGRLIADEGPLMGLAAALLWLQTALMTALLVAGSTLLPVAGNAVLAAVIFILGRLADALHVTLADAPVVQSAVRTIVPNLRIYDISELFVREAAPPWELLPGIAAVTAAGVVLLLSLGAAILTSREIG